MALNPSPRFWDGKVVLVTGHTGFKGAWLSLWLASLGSQVVGLANGRPSAPCLYDVAGVSKDVVSTEADVRKLDQVLQVVSEHRPEIVFHLAAQPLVRRSYIDPVETFATNVMGSVHVLEATRRVASARVVVNVTSDKCYENREWPWAYREQDTLGGRDPYSSSKACVELVTSAFAASFFNHEGTAAVATARAGNVIGGGDWGADRLIPDLMRATIADRPARLRNPAAVRPWQHVVNPLAGYLLMAERMWHDRAYAGAWNFGPVDADALPVATVVERVSELWGPGLHWEQDPDDHPHEAHDLRVDAARARQQLGWLPTWDLAHGLAATVAWYRAYARGADMRAFTLAQLREFQGALSEVPTTP